MYTEIDFFGVTAKAVLHVYSHFTVVGGKQYIGQNM